MNKRAISALIRERADMRRLLAASWRPFPTSRLPKHLRRLLSLDKQYLQLVRDYKIISRSPLFDAAWYTDNYANVKENGEDPIHHFLKFGCEYLLSPGPHFDTKAYFADNPLVRARGENPLLHFIASRSGVGGRWGWLDKLMRSGPPPDPSEAASDPYVATITSYETSSGWASGQTGARIAFLIVPRPGAEAELTETLVSLEALRGWDWQALVATGDARPGATAKARVEHVRLDTDVRGAMLARLLAATDCEFFCVLDVGDRVSPHALQEIWQRLTRRPDLDLVYSDEDVAEPSGRARPLLKPDWSPDYFESVDHIGRLSCIRTSAARSAGSFSDAYGAAAEYHLNLRICDRARHIEHIAKILCHRSPAGRALATDRATAEDRRDALADLWARRGIAATVIVDPHGTLRSLRPLAWSPLVSIIIQARNDADRLGATLAELSERTAYPIEIVIVDHLSTDPAVAELYSDLESDERIRIVSFTAPFNPSAAANLGAGVARGSMLLFLSNAIEVTDPNWLEELVGCLERPAAGIAGTMLLTPSGEVKNAGWVLGPDGVREPIFRGASADAWSPFGSPSVPRNAIGVSGECQMVRRDVFDMLGGFDETYQTDAGGAALSMAAWRAGYRTIYTPFAALICRKSESEPDADLIEDRSRIMRDMINFGIATDPYFHPALRAAHPLPAFTITPDGSASDDAPEALDAHRGLSKLNLFDRLEVGRTLGPEDAGAVFWDPQSPSRLSDEWGAIRFVVDLLQRVPGLRERFPRALSEGANGAFARWLASDDGCARFGLPASALASIEAAFALRPADLVRRVLLFDETVRRQHPVGCTPAGLADLFLWLVRTGRHEHGLRIETIWWFVLECAEQPTQELVWAYAFDANIQRLFPDGLTVFGRAQMARWLRVMYRVDGEWLDPTRWPVDISPADQIRLAYRRREFWQRLHPRALESADEAAVLLDWLDTDAAAVENEARDWLRTLDRSDVAAELAGVGANVLGHFLYPSGLRTSVESMVEGLRAAGCSTSLRDIWVEAQWDDPLHVTFNGLESYDVTIIHAQPEPLFDKAYQRAGLFPRRPKTYRIAYWYWELEEIPAQWAEVADEVDELWVATRFVADAARALFDKPVHEMLPGLELSTFNALPRSHFGLADDRFTFLFVFHMTSIIERKNPLGLIRAFRAAFGHVPAPQLVIKTSFSERHRAAFEEMREAAVGEGIIIIDAIFSPVETLSIMNVCDCYVSLHRSEGFGLTMAEAMLLGKPVIATAYSGNLDFMTADNSLLVEHDFCTLERDYPPYIKGSRWAAPSIDHAAACMRRVFEDRALAERLGMRAKADLTEALSYANTGARMRTRLEEIRRMRRETRNIDARPIRF